MPDSAKKRRFRSFFTRKKKDYNLSYTKREQPILDELARLPEGSTPRVELRARLDAAKVKAAADESPRKDMQQLLKDAKKAVAAVAAVAPEVEISSPMRTDATIESADRGAAERLVLRHSNAIVAAFTTARTELAALKTAVKQQDLSIGDVTLDLDKTLNNAERDEARYAAGTLMDTAQDLDTQAQGADVDATALAAAMSSLTGAITAHMVVVQQKVDALKTEIAAAMSDPGTLQAMAATALGAEQAGRDKAAFLHALAAAEAQVMIIEDWDHPDAATHRREISDKASTPAERHAQAAEALIAKKEELEALIRTTKDAYDRKAAAVAAKAKRVKGNIDALMLSTALDESYGAYIEAMRNEFLDEFAAIDLMIGTGANDAALDAASRMLDDIERRAANFDSNFGAVEMVKVYEWQCDAALRNKNHAKMCPDLQATLQKKYDTLMAASGKMDPTDAASKFKALRNEIAGSQAESYVSLAKARLAWLKDFSARAKAADKELAKMLKAMTSLVPAGDNKDFFKKYQGPLATDLADARTLAGKESQASMDLADEKLGDVVTKTAEAIAAMAKAPDARSADENQMCMDVVTGQSAAVLEARQQAADMAAFKVEYAALKSANDIAGMRIETKPHLAGELNAIKQLSKNAKEVMENTHDLEQARAIMAAADKRRVKLLADVARPPTELATIARDWNTATGNMKKAFASLQTKAISAVAPANDDALTDAAGTIQAKMEAAAKYLTDEKFLDEMNFYTRSALEPADLRRQRERTLAKIKLLRDYLSNDPMLRAAQTNPFGEKAVISPLFMTLRDIEHKVMVSG